MKIKIDTTGLRESKWYEYVVGFAFGGTVTALTGVIARHFGPEIGGLFLAFPAILPATATLIEKHETEKKQQHGKIGIASGRRAAGVDAAGAAMGCLGLIVFAVIVWKALPASSLALVLIVATIVWLITSVAVWMIRESIWRAIARKFHASHHVRPVTPNHKSSAPRRTR
jgi:hypothetical protein